MENGAEGVVVPPIPTNPLELCTVKLPGPVRPPANVARGARAGGDEVGGVDEAGEVAEACDVEFVGGGGVADADVAAGINCSFFQLG